MTDEQNGGANPPEEDFAALLEQSMTGMTRLEPGQKIEATVLQISEEWVFLDVGQKGEGVLDRKELLDNDGNLTIVPGQQLSVYFLSPKGGELMFTTRLGGGASGTARLEEAWRSGIPVEGRVEKEVKGGYEVTLPGNVRSFCPFSQVGLRRPDDPEAIIGTTLSFKIIKFEERGRNLVVSHREILEEERRQQREALKETLKEGQVVAGTVTNIRDFGAFVDIGGIEGLLPISELSYGRVETVDDVVRVGQQIEVAVKKIDWEQQRFSFSLRDTLADPWSKVGSIYQAGETYPGTVSRLAKFGAFVTLEDGIDGLLHISKIGGDQRIKHPQDVLAVGQKLDVIVEKIDRDERRISLAMPTEQTDEVTETSYEEKADTGMGTFADLFKQARDRKD